MELKEAIIILKKAVKYTGTIDQKHIDLTLVAASERPLYEAALKVVNSAVKAGDLKREDLLRQLELDA
jgi:hypothetical protein